MKQRRKYARKPTKRIKNIRQIRNLFILTAILVAIIGYYGNSLEIHSVEAIQIDRVQIYPEIEDDVKRYVLTEFYNAGLNPDKIDRMLSECENKKWDTDAKYKNNDKHRSIDRGLFMINDYWHAEVSNECAYNLECSTKEAIRIVKEKTWKEWVCGRTLDL